MNVALLIHTFDPAAGGVEAAAGNLARALIERGHEVHVFARRFGRELPAIRPHPVHARSLLPGGRHTAYARNVHAALQGQRFDVVHSFTRTLSHDLIRLGGGTHREYLLRMESERSPLGAWFSRINPKERAILALEREGFRRGNYRKIVAVSAQVRNEVIQHYGVPAEDVLIIPNGVDTKRFHPGLRGEVRSDLRRELGLDRMTLLFAGTGFARKGLRHAIETAARVPDTLLLVVGRGDSAPYREQAAHLGVSDRIRFLGPRTGMERLYAAADLLILPTLYDPFPNVCLEAMACGTPVVTTAVTGVAEILHHGKDSFVVSKAGDVDAMVACVKDARNRNDLGPAAAATARQYTVERNVEENLRLYETLKRSAPPLTGSGALDTMPAVR